MQSLCFELGGSGLGWLLVRSDPAGGERQMRILTWERPRPDAVMLAEILGRLVLLGIGLLGGLVLLGKGVLAVLGKIRRR